jgi:hypothetical protein
VPDRRTDRQRERERERVRRGREGEERVGGVLDSRFDRETIIALDRGGCSA